MSGIIITPASSCPLTPVITFSQFISQLNIDNMFENAIESAEAEMFEPTLEEKNAVIEKIKKVFGKLSGKKLIQAIERFIDDAVATHFEN
jgi:hypothetical protein